MPKRMRIFAGPNGSGKTSIINRLKDKISFGSYINADDIEADLLNNGYQLPSDLFNIECSSLTNYLTQSPIVKSKLSDVNYTKALEIVNGKVRCDNQYVNSYLAAAIAEYLRSKHLEKGISFTFETVFSHPSKIELINKAIKKGFRVYLYYISTESADINVRRVQIRVAQHGHQVPELAIKNRYERTMKLLPEIIKLTNRAYLFDNSGAQSVYFAEITNGEQVQIRSKEDDIPNWFFNYVLHD